MGSGLRTTQQLGRHRGGQDPMLAQTATHTEFISSRHFDAPCLTGQ